MCFCCVRFCFVIPSQEIDLGNVSRATYFVSSERHKTTTESINQRGWLLFGCSLRRHRRIVTACWSVGPTRHATSTRAARAPATTIPLPTLPAPRPSRAFASVPAAVSPRTRPFRQTPRWIQRPSPRTCRPLRRGRHR